jgi:hypothetical protein
MKIEFTDVVCCDIWKCGASEIFRNDELEAQLICRVYLFVKSMVCTYCIR